MKQTAVEWLQDKLKNVKPTQFCSIDTIKEWVDQAKEMEKEQIIQAITKTIVNSNIIYDKEYPEVTYTAEKYYNETFKSE